MIRLFITLTLAVTMHSVCAQNSIHGKVKSAGDPVPFATVLLLGEDSSFVKGSISNENSEFAFEDISKGSYLLSITAVGFNKYVSRPIVLSDPNTTLPDIELSESLHQLNEIVVSAEKPLFEQQSDRIIINTESSATSAGNSVLEVLQKSPGVLVNKQSGNISMNGRSGVKIMINGKVMQVPADVAVQLLDGLNASQVQKIELISSPDSKHDADGQAGIINIVTKTDVALGTTATLVVTAGAKWAEVWGANASLTHRNKKFGYSIDFSHLSTHNKHVTKLERWTTHGTSEYASTQSPRENLTDQQNLSANLEWKPTKRAALNLSVIGYRRNWDLRGTAEDINYRETDTVLTRMKITETNRWQSVITSLGVTSGVGKASELSLSFDYLYYHNYNPSNYSNSVADDGQSPEQKISLGKNTPINTLVSKLDFTNRLSDKLTWDVGAKVVSSTFKNDVVAEELNNEVWVSNPQFSSSSSLSEKIGAVYSSANWQPTACLNVNGGLRYEYTNTSITSNGNQSLDRKYGYLFPTLSVRQKLGENRSLSVVYSKRVTRPTYNDIAPFVFTWSPGIFSAGNTELWPSVADGVSVTHQLKQWNTGLQYTLADREISFLQPEPDPERNGIIYRTQNLKWFRTISLNNSISAPVTRWWEMHGSVMLMHQSMETTHLPVNIKRSRGVVNVYLNNSFTLPKNSSIELSATFQSTAFFGMSYFFPVGSLNFGVQKSFGSNNVLRFAVDDILNTNNWNFKMNIRENGFKTSFYYHWHNRYIRLTYTWKLGNKDLRSVRSNSGSQDEQKRVQ